MIKYNNFHFPSLSGENKAKKYKDIFYLFVIILIFLYVMLKVNYVNKIPLTSDSVADIVSNHGYQAADITYQYYANESWKSVLDKCIGFQDDDIHFEYFVYKDSKTALNFYDQVCEIIIKYKSGNNIETNFSDGNYNIYSLESLGKFRAVTRVDNTVVYTYCLSENKSGILSILDEMDYLNESSVSDVKEDFSIDLLLNPKVIIFGLFILVLIWLALGRPGLKKKKYFVKSISKLESKGFAYNASIHNDYFEHSDSVSTMSKDNLSVEIAEYSSLAVAEEDFVDIYNELSKLIDTPQYTHKKTRGSYQEYAIAAGNQSFIVCNDNYTVVLYSADGNQIDELIKLNKHIK